MKRGGYLCKTCAFPIAPDPSSGPSVSSSSTTVIVPKSSFCNVVPSGRLPPAKKGTPLAFPLPFFVLKAFVVPPRPVRNGMLLLLMAASLPLFTLTLLSRGNTAPFGRAKGNWELTVTSLTIPAMIRADGLDPPSMSCMKNVSGWSPDCGRPADATGAKAGEAADVAAGSEVKMRLAYAVVVKRKSVKTERESDGACFCILRGFQKLFKMVEERVGML
jgi:hypothetical protein